MIQFESAVAVKVTGTNEEVKHIAEEFNKWLETEGLAGNSTQVLQGQGSHAILAVLDPTRTAYHSQKRLEWWLISNRAARKSA